MHALLMIALVAATPTPKPEVLEGHLPSAAALVPASSEGRLPIYSSIRMTVSGSILCVLGAGSAIGGIYSLIGAAQQTGSARTVFTVLGWTFAGLGMLFGAIGIPLLIVGIANLATPPGVALSVTQQGELAVTF